ncbi:MAG: type II toxin-antitoxin system HigB family toxin [Gemmataceae bacterium]|nr:type II toxin-antitoxin system HigB family toxin [Gemmataceae bacterium]MCI0742988.1 type II toxin-antitoxin system HigB family toxin [Gemmataceae bacterium]
MHVISRKKLREFWEIHQSGESPLRAWFKMLRQATWSDPKDMQKVFGRKVDQVNQFTVFDIGGNKYRLITVIDFERQKIFIRNVLTHAEYDEEKWKDDSFRLPKKDEEAS